jgi:formylglycine-generating enzyme required for sulfatase activity
MVVDFVLLLIILAVCAALVLIFQLFKQVKSRVRLRIGRKKGVLEEKAFLQFTSGSDGQNSGAEVRLLSDPDELPIGEVLVKDNKGWAYIPKQLGVSLSGKPDYQKCGFVDESGYIYKYVGKNFEPVRIGFLACPSAPNVPTIHGDSSMMGYRKVLNAYLGDPLPEGPASEEAKPAEEKKDEKTDEENRSFESSEAMAVDGETIEAENPVVEAEDTSSELLEIVERLKSGMVKVEGGSFKMGINPAENKKPDYRILPDEAPAHMVTLDNFYIGKYQVTIGEWNAVMGDIAPLTGNKDFPAVGIGWDLCSQFIERINLASGLEFSLPTEAQWEYAAKGGKYTQNKIYAGSDIFSDVGWNTVKVPVGKKKANELGICDMCGLSQEWCQDWYAPYGAEELFNPVVGDDSASGEGKRVLRGGNATVTGRKFEMPDYASDDCGFRLVCKVPAVDVPGLGFREAPVLVGTAIKKGWGNAKSGCPITDEARGGVFTLFHFLHGKSDYEEFSASAPYGWMDSALPAAVVYIVIYLSMYLVNSGILGFPMYDYDKIFLSHLVLVGFYFIVWAVVRFIKIDSIEGGYSIKPQLDMIDKSLGHRAVDIIAILLCLFCLIDIDLIPIAWVIVLGIGLNMLNKEARLQWNVVNPLSAAESGYEDDLDEETGLMLPPHSFDERKTVLKDYSWFLTPFVTEEEVKADVSVPFVAGDVEDMRSVNPFFLESPDMSPGRMKTYVESMIKKLKADKRSTQHLRYLVQWIGIRADRFGLGEMDRLQFYLNFVQSPNISFREDDKSLSIKKPLRYVRYPEETLYDKEGDSDCKCLLLLSFFNAMGYDTLFLISQDSRTAVAVSPKTGQWKEFIAEDQRESVCIERHGKTYLYCSVEDGRRIGECEDGMTVEKYQLIIESDYSDEDSE